MRVSCNFSLKPNNARHRPSLAILSRPGLRSQLVENWRGLRYLGCPLLAPGVRLLADLGYAYGVGFVLYIWGSWVCIFIFGEVGFMLKFARLVIFFQTDFSDGSYSLLTTIVLEAYLSVCMSIFLSPTHPPHQSIHPSIHPSTHLCMYVYVYV